MLTKAFFFSSKRSQVSLWNKVRQMSPRGKSFSSVCVCGEVCICAFVSAGRGCMDRLQKKPIYILDMPVSIRELQHHSVLLTALACNCLTEVLSLIRTAPQLPRTLDATQWLNSYWNIGDSWLIDIFTCCLWGSCPFFTNNILLLSIQNVSSLYFLKLQAWHWDNEISVPCSGIILGCWVKGDRGSALMVHSCRA